MREVRYLEDRKLAPEDLGRVLILGLGVSGKAAVRYLSELLGTRVRALGIMTGSSDDAARAWAQPYIDRGVEVFFDTEEVQGAWDLCIASPGISEFSDFYLSAKAASGEVVSEVEFAWRESAKGSSWVAITGTNGKTTTTALTEHLLKTAGLAARAVGNIGDTCIEAVSSGEVDVYVAEVSSYQLASTADFAPEVALVLNITPDHLSWHRSHENYAAAKWRVLRNLAKVPGSTAVLNACDDEVRAKIVEIKSLSAEDRGFSYVPAGCAHGTHGDMRAICGSDNAAFVTDEGMLHVAVGACDVDLIALCDLQIKGGHNVENALCAAAAALSLGVDPASVSAGLRSFAPLEHRIEPAGFVGDVACYNDSKATNVDAVLKALVAFSPEKPVIMLGGHDKGTDLADLVSSCEKNAAGIVCFGEARERFYRAFCPLREKGVPVESARNMANAFDLALELASPAGIVLLSPACASFDEFSCFEERGRAFKELVRARALEVPGR